MIRLYLGPLFVARGIEDPYTYLKKNGFPRHTASRLLSGYYTHLHFDYLEKLCVLLRCSPNELLHYTPASGQQLAADHPLLELKKSLPVLNWKERIGQMPLPKLLELMEQIKAMDDPGESPEAKK